MPNDNSLPGSLVHVMAISQGVAIGPVHLVKSTSLAVESAKIGSDQVGAEQERLQKALAAAVEELVELGEHVAQTVGQSEACIFEAQQLILQDPEILAETTELVARYHLSAAAALQQAAEHQAQELESLENETLAARATDIRDVAARAVRHLQSPGAASASIGEDSTPVLLFAHDLTPSDTASLDPKTILGICTVVGGPTTHAAIIARALEIPAVARIDPQLLDRLHDGQQVAMDGTQGLLYLYLDDEQQQQELLDVMHRQQQARDLRRTQQDAQGIGLLRTEFLFGGRQLFPGEQEQFESYVALYRAFAGHTSLGKTIIARTLDAGADKPFPALEPLIGAWQEANPALGLRGARIHLLHEELLRQQLRALLRAGVETGVQLYIMFPMIATLEEVCRLRAVYAAVQHELSSEGVVLSQATQLGIMIETPAAAWMAGVLAREVDFFSIGANDLFQYTMAADRTNSRVTGMFGELEPAVWRSIAFVVRAGVEHGKLVAVCGELAADARIGPLLAGLGVQELSMSPPAIVKVKAALHKHPMDYWRKSAQELLKAETAAEVQDVLASIE